MITTDIRQPLTNPQDCYFAYLIICFDYLIIRLWGKIKQICICSGNVISTLRNHICHLKQTFGLYQ